MGKHTGIKRLIKAFYYSLAGFRAAWKNEEAFRQEILAGIIVVPAAAKAVVLIKLLRLRLFPEFDFIA